MIWAFLHHWSSAIQLRAYLYREILKAKRDGNKLPKRINKMIWKAPHDHEEFIWLLRFIPTSESVTLIDVGGNSGFWAEQFSLYYPDNAIYAFEPIPEMFDQYKHRFLKNPYVKVFNVALGNEEKEEELNISNTYSLTSFNLYHTDLKEINENFKRKEKVTVTKLDRFFPEIEFRKTIVKIDVQGYESHVVRGGLKVIEKADLIILECSFVEEYQGQLPTFGDIVPILRTLGFHPLCYGVFDKTRGPIAFERNVLFVKEKYFNQIWKY